MRAGAFKEWITIKKFVPPAVKQGRLGTPNVSQKTFETINCWAQVMQKPSAADEFLDEDRIEADIRHTIRIRWEHGMGEDYLNGESYIEFQGFHMNIISWFILRERGIIEINTKAAIK